MTARLHPPPAEQASPRFTVFAGGQRFESDSFVGVVRQMLARGLSNDAVLTAALETCRRHRAGATAS